MRGNARAPDFIARAIIPRTGIDENGDEFGRGLRRDDDGSVAWRLYPVRAQYRGDGQIGAIRKPNKIGGGDVKRGGDTVEPIHRNGTRAGFKPPDGLRGGGRIAAAGDIFQCHITRTAHFADGSDHLGQLSRLNRYGFLLSYSFAEMARVERSGEEEIEMARILAKGKSVRRVTVNLAESPLSWLNARRMITPRQFEAGERIRLDYETAMLGPRVTMRWETPIGGKVQRRAPEGLDPTLAQISAKRRFDAAMAEVGSGLADIVWRVVCAGEGLATAEKGLGWPSRAGKLVLMLALDRLATHYRIA